MDSIIRPEGSNTWVIFGTEGMTLGMVMRQENGYVILPTEGSQLADLDILVFVSLDAAREAVAAHLQGECVVYVEGERS